jgi:hypothetical protein
MENVRKSMEGRFGGEASFGQLSAIAGLSRRRFAYDAAIKASWKRIFALTREMLVVERASQPDEDERRANAGVPGNLGNFVEAYSPMLQWLRGRD